MARGFERAQSGGGMILSTTRKSAAMAATALLVLTGGSVQAQDVTRRPLNPGSMPQLQFDPQTTERAPQGAVPGSSAVPPAGNAPASRPAGKTPAGAAKNAPAAEAQPRRLENPVAEFSGIDKITGRIISFDVYVNETVQFGALQVTPRVCYASPDEDEPKTDSFVEVDEITLDRKIRRIFTGWMFAESPGLNAVEHPVYDVWLKSCKKSSEVPPPQAVKAGN